jgi:predicted acylesterase/phospholipase RssA
LSGSSAKDKAVENVLIMQGGGSLGAFACGVYKGLAKRNVQIDIIAGTSVGAVNAAIIVGSRRGDPEKDLEEFWLEIAESSPTIIPDLFTVDYDENTLTGQREYLRPLQMLRSLVFLKCLFQDGHGLGHHRLIHRFYL